MGEFEGAGSEDGRSVPIGTSGDAALEEQIAKSVDPELSAGDIVGEYEIESKLGEGGFGKVFRAVHPLIGKVAAVKVLNREFSSNPQMVSRFVEEARAVNRIRHKNIIDIFNFGRLDDGRNFFVMELLDGLSFDDYLEQNGAMSPALAMKVLGPVGRALDAAHEAEIVHRDLKPDNIFLSFDDDGEPVPKLLDFGIAKLLGDAGAISGHKTRTGAPVGTPHYMSPEQCLGLELDHRTDVYAFGVVAFEALTGDVPFHGNSFLELMNKQASAKRPLVSEKRPALGTHFDDVIRTLMALDPDERPDTVGDAMQLLIDACERGGVDLGKVSQIPEHARKPMSKRSREVAGADTVAAGSGVTNVETMQQTPVIPGERRPTRSLLWVALGAAAVCVVGYVALGTGDSPSAVVDTAPSGTVASVAESKTARSAPAPSAPAPSAPAPAIGASAVPPAAKVSVRVLSAVVGAKAYLDGKELGVVPGPFLLEPHDRPVTIVVKKPGFRDVRGEIQIEEGATLRLNPVPIPRAAPKRKIHEDLIEPDYLE